jgi:hypothetical protein
MWYFIELPAAERNEMEVTDLQDLEPGQYVKVEGYINSIYDIPLSRSYTRSESDDEPKWLTYNFYLNDTKNQILIINSGVLKSARNEYIEPGRHNNGKEYWNGDKVCIIGKVKEHNDELRIESEYIGKHEGDFAYSPIMVVIGLPLLFLGIFLSARTTSTIRNRRRYHLQNADNYHIGLPQKDKYTVEKSLKRYEDTGLYGNWNAKVIPWEDKRKIFRKGGAVTLGISIILLFIIFFFIYLYDVGTWMIMAVVLGIFGIMLMVIGISFLVVDHYSVTLTTDSKELWDVAQEIEGFLKEQDIQYERDKKYASTGVGGTYGRYNLLEHGISISYRMFSGQSKMVYRWITIEKIGKNNYMVALDIQKDLDWYLHEKELFT